MSISTSSKYGLGREQVPGTFVAPGNGMLSTKGGIPVEGYVPLNLGDQIAVHPKMLGLPFDVEYSRIYTGKMPSVPTMDHNIHQAILGVLLASMTGVYSYAAGLATIRPLSDGIFWEYGNSAVDNFTFSVWHEPGSAASDSMVVGGNVCNSLTLTFPQGGGPVRMAWTSVGMSSDYDQAAQSAGNYGYPAAATLDHLASDFRFFIGASGSPVEFYPDGDVVVTFTPVIQVQKRCQQLPRIISISKYMVTAEFTWPWDADSDINAYYAQVASSTLRHLHITNAYNSAWDDAPNAAGEFSLSVLGVQEEQPQTGGDGIIGERVRLNGRGGSSGGSYDWPYIAKLYDATTFADF